MLAKLGAEILTCASNHAADSKSKDTREQPQAVWRFVSVGVMQVVASAKWKAGFSSLLLKVA